MAQIARPNSDVAVGSWENEGGSTPLYASVDETAANDDTDYVRCHESAANPCEVGLDTLTDPAVSSGHVVRYRYRKDAPQSLDLTVRLLQGATTVASQAHADISTSYTDGSFTLSSGEADSITDYSDLRLEFEATNRGVRVTWAEFEVPDAGAGGDSSDKERGTVRGAARGVMRGV